MLNVLKRLKSAVGLLAFVATTASASSIALWGNNTGFSGLATGAGHTVTVVTDAQVATPGFLSAFDVFVNSRCDGCFGTALSAGASGQVQSFATGNVFLFNGDWFDAVSFETSPTVDQLVLNAITFAAASGGGYIGEFSGTTQAMTSNVESLIALNLISGAATTSAELCCSGEGNVTLTAAGLAHSVTAGLAGSFPENPPNVEFAAQLTGVSSAQVLARFSNDNPALIARSAANAVPTPAPWVLGMLGLLALGISRRAAKR